jgi:hypothetical protein
MKTLGELLATEKSRDQLRRELYLRLGAEFQD